MGIVQSYAGLVVARVFLGVAEVLILLLKLLWTIGILTNGKGWFLSRSFVPSDMLVSAS